MTAIPAPHLSAVIVIQLLGACDYDTTPPPAPAELEVISSTVGVPIPQGGYTITLDNEHIIRLPTNGSHVFTNLVAGAHTLELSELPGDCRVTGKNPRTVTAVAGASTLSVFQITCSPPNSGTVLIKTATYGRGPPVYEVELGDHLFSERIGPSDKLTLFPVPVGTHIVTLAPVPQECQLVGFNPRLVVVRQAGSTAGTIFKVHCPQ
jgi:hypothetical protein